MVYHAETNKSRINMTRYPVPATRYPIPDTRYPVPGTRYPVPAARYPVAATRYPLPGTRYPVPATRTRVFHHAVTLGFGVILTYRCQLISQRPVVRHFIGYIISNV